MQNDMASSLWRLICTFGFQEFLKAGESSLACSWVHGPLVDTLLGDSVELDSAAGKVGWDFFLGVLGLGLNKRP